MYRILCLVGGISESDLREVCIKIGFGKSAYNRGFGKSSYMLYSAESTLNARVAFGGAQSPRPTMVKVMLLQLLYTLLRYTSTVSYNYAR